MREQGNLWRRLAAGYIAWSPWIAAVFGAAVAGFLAARLSAGAKAVLSDAVTIGWTTAIATFAAAVTALKIAQDSQNRSAASDKLRGQIQAARHFSNIDFSADLFEEAIQEMNNSKLPLREKMKVLNKRLRAILGIMNQFDIPLIHGYDPALAGTLIDLADLVGFHVMKTAADRSDTDLLASARTLLDPEVREIFKRLFDQACELAADARSPLIDPYTGPQSVQHNAPRTDGG
ncbi:hypothetical protein [Achromobacter dolens]|uniref:hypothetical protein n=1 Tax=Achromobacter dolens TaxID=1287738 RepID=UPI00119F72D0|nr:hypothetical protein [Achromobacter dolens]CAB3642988.1 hypothetical protein LMG26840_02205 [Achromobacter dolens]